LVKAKNKVSYHLAMRFWRALAKRSAPMVDFAIDRNVSNRCTEQVPTIVAVFIFYYPVPLFSEPVPIALIVIIEVGDELAFRGL
jgi:hypothetical protein